MQQWGLRTDNCEFGVSQLQWVKLLGETRTNACLLSCSVSAHQENWIFCVVQSHQFCKYHSACRP